MSEQDRAKESDLGMAAGGERIIHTPHSVGYILTLSGLVAATEQKGYSAG